MELTCPKCQGAMRQYERNGVTIDQCGECRGIFLDRGELEKLTDAETSYYAGGAERQAPNPVQQQPIATQPFPQYDQIPPQAAPYRRHYGSAGSPDSPGYYGGQQYGHQRRRKSFLSELFD